MTTIRDEAIKWLGSLKAEIGKSEHRTLWHYEEAIDMAIEALTDRPHGRLIDADALLDKLPKEYFGSTIHLLINDAPTVSADRLHGEWIEKNSHTYICDHCGFEQAIYGNLDEYNYCPNCGAKMKGYDSE